MIRLPAGLREAILAHGRDSYREEACGVLYGRSARHDKEVLHVQPLLNSRDGERHRRFLITPRDYQRAEKEARSQRMTLIGFYHSHPDHPAYPSKFDLEHALPFFSYPILAVQEGVPLELRSFVMKEDRSAFLEEKVQIV